MCADVAVYDVIENNSIHFVYNETRLRRYSVKLLNDRCELRPRINELQRHKRNLNLSIRRVERNENMFCDRLLNESHRVHNCVLMVEYLAKTIPK